MSSYSLPSGVVRPSSTTVKYFSIGVEEGRLEVVYGLFFVWEGKVFDGCLVRVSPCDELTTLKRFIILNDNLLNMLVCEGSSSIATVII